MKKVLLVIFFVFQQGCYGEKVKEFNHVIENIKFLSSPVAKYQIKDVYFCIFECLTYYNICKSVNFNYIRGICLLFDVTISEMMKRSQTTSILCTQHWVYYGSDEIKVLYLLSIFIQGVTFVTLRCYLTFGFNISNFEIN